MNEKDAYNDPIGSFQSIDIEALQEHFDRELIAEEMGKMVMGNVVNQDLDTKE